MNKKEFFFFSCGWAKIYIWRHIETELIIGNNNILHHCIRMFFMRRFCLFLCLFVVTSFAMWFVPSFFNQRKYEEKFKRNIIDRAVSSIPLCQFIQQKSIYLGWLALCMHTQYTMGNIFAVLMLLLKLLVLILSLWTLNYYLSSCVFFCILVGLWIVLLWNLWAHRRK